MCSHTLYGCSPIANSFVFCECNPIFVSDDFYPFFVFYIVSEILIMWEHCEFTR